MVLVAHCNCLLCFGFVIFGCCMVGVVIVVGLLVGRVGHVGLCFGLLGYLVE
jgi:tetrahydrodipicolinate N-succinyltransferase